MKLKFAANLSMLFTEYAFMDRFEQAAQAGFGAVEFLFPYEYGLDAVGAELEKHDLHLALFNLPPGDQEAGDWGCLGLPGRQADFRRQFDQALEAAAQLRCDHLHALFGQRLPYVEPEVQVECAFHNLSWAAPLAAKEGVIIMIEALNPKDFPAFFLSKPSVALDLVRKVDHPNIRLQYDFYHAQLTEGDLIANFESAQPWIGHVQIADVPGRHEPGTGEVDFDSIFIALRERQYSGFIGLEYHPLYDTLSSLDWLPKDMRGLDV